MGCGDVGGGGLDSEKACKVVGSFEFDLTGSQSSKPTQYLSAYVVYGCSNSSILYSVRTGFRSAGCAYPTHQQVTKGLGGGWIFADLLEFLQEISYNGVRSGGVVVSLSGAPDSSCIPLPRYET